MRYVAAATVRSEALDRTTDTGDHSFPKMVEGTSVHSAAGYLCGYGGFTSNNNIIG